MKQFKKILALVLVLALVLPGMVFAMEDTSMSKFSQTTLTNEKIKELKEKKAEMTLQETEEEQLNEPIETEEPKEESGEIGSRDLAEIKNKINELLNREKFIGDVQKQFGDDDVVRVIVEIDEEPIIKYASNSSLSYSSLSESKIHDLETRIYEAQEAIKREIVAKNIDMNYFTSFNTVFAGFSGEIKYADIEVVEQIAGVKKVYISNEYTRPIIEPDMASSHDMIGSNPTWLAGYQGEGTVIAIIDTGVDPNHQDMKLSDETEPKLSEDSLSGKGLKGKYFTEKVPYGFNYYDQSNQILDLGPDASEHGMHVAGTAGANGKIKGVAPEAQLLAMKVFSNDPIYSTTFDDIYLEAIEEAIKLEADVLNMSLGSTASFYEPESPVNIAITNAVNNGIVCAISAGNSGYTFYGWSETNYGYPLKEDPDYGLVGAPGLSYDSIQVASVENIKQTVPYLTYEIPGVAEVLPNNTVIIDLEAYDLSTFNTSPEIQIKLFNALNSGKKVYVKFSNAAIVDHTNKLADFELLPKTVTYIDKDGNSSLRSVIPGTGTGEPETIKVPMAVAGSIDPASILEGPQEFVDGGSGHPSELTNVAGKVALIVRGGLTSNFTDKITNAQNAGAIGIIVRNHEAGGEDLVNMQTPAVHTVPTVFIGYKGGLGLMELEEKYITFSDDVMTVSNPKGGQMSDFTSWGTTPTLELKPEITAPGGQIYSTLQNNKYGVMSGTSMAAPHVAGGSAVVMQYIKEKYAELPPAEQTRLAKVLLMNTANILIEDDYAPYSPRRQGAGLMNVHDAIVTDVRVVNKDSGEAKVELKDFEATKFTMEFTATNDSGADIEYKISVDVLADYIHPLGLNLLASDYLDAVVTTNALEDIIKVPANDSADFTVTVDISNADIYRNMFVEGFVKLNDVKDEHPELSVPYVGFYGDWEEPRILDGMEDIGEDSYFGISGMIDTDGYFSGPVAALNHSEYGQIFGVDTLTPVLSFLRNAEEVRYNILNENGVRLRTITIDQHMRKNYINGGSRNPYTLLDSWTWDGTARGQYVPDGKYIYQIASRIQNSTNWQYKNVFVDVDTKAPVINDLEYDTETGKISFKVNDDNGTGLMAYFVYLNGKALPELDNIVLGEEQEVYEIYVGDIVNAAEGDYEFTIEAIDFGWNLVEDSIKISNDQNIPYIYLLTPELFDVSNTPQVRLNGIVFKNNEITSIKAIYGDTDEDLLFNYVKNIILRDSAGNIIMQGPGYVFDKTLTFEDGLQNLKIVAKSEKNEIEIVRAFYVDTTKPEIQVEIDKINPIDKTVDLKITMKDNFPVLKLEIFDSVEYVYDGMDRMYNVNPVEKVTTVTVALFNVGDNIIELALSDIAGNKTKVLYVVELTEPTDEDFVNADKEALEIDFAAGDSEDSVTKDLVLPTKGAKGSTITWASNHPEIIAVDGKVAVPEEDTKVTLTATLTKGEATATKEFTVTVLAVKSVKISDLADLTLYEGEEKELTFTVDPADADIEVTAAGDGIGIVNKGSKYYVKAIEAGEATVTVKASKDGFKDAEQTIDVTVKPYPITNLEGKYTLVGGEEGKEMYVAYLLFNLTEEFDNIQVIVNGEHPFEQKADEDDKLRFEGATTEMLDTVVIILDGVEFEVVVNWQEVKGEEAESMINAYFNN